MPSTRRSGPTWEPGLYASGARGPGHIIGLTWDAAVPKFGIDRGAGVWNDYGNPDRFRLWYEFGNLAEGIGEFRKSRACTMDCRWSRRYLNATASGTKWSSSPIR